MPKDKTKNLFESSDQSTDLPGGQIVRVALDNGADSLFDYVLPEYMGEVQPGRRVQVPFGKANKLLSAFVVQIIADPKTAAQCRKFNLKSIRAVIDEQPLLNEQLMQLAQWISHYYVCPLGEVLSAMVPAAVKQDSGVKKQAMVYWIPESESQIDQVTSAKQKALIELLQKAKAVDVDSAMEKTLLLELADCTEAPLKQLLRKQFIRIIQKEVLHALPIQRAGVFLGSQNDSSERGPAESVGFCFNRDFRRAVWRLIASWCNRQRQDRSLYPGHSGLYRGGQTSRYSAP
jgi:primosomal protein N' (replication factor Y)